MSADEIDKLALESAAKNNGVLARLPTGRWRGVFPGPQFETPVIRRLLKAGKVVETKRSEKWEHRNGGVLEEVRLAS